MVWQVFLFFWELPQNLAGILSYFYFIRSVRETKRVQHHLFCKVSPYSVSLGRFIFWSDYMHPDPGLSVRAHEYGHAVQSLMLGPLYLFVVGIPSALRHFYSSRYLKKHGTEWKGYFNGFPENWADALGRKYFKDS